MRMYVVAALIITMSPLSTSLAQSDQTQKSTADLESADYSFAVVVTSKVLTTEGDWKQGGRLREYANGHEGTYIVFAAGTSLFLQRDLSAISKALELYQEVARLGKEQEILQARQAPLTKEQGELSKQMKEATSAEDIRRVGAEQGRIGNEQGAIGREQGKVGQEQGTAGRTFYSNVQASLKRCIHDRNCSKA